MAAERDLSRATSAAEVAPANDGVANQVEPRSTPVAAEIEPRPDAAGAEADLKRERLVGVGLTLVSALSFAWLPIFFRYATEAGANVPTVLALRFSIAAAITWALLARAGLPRVAGRRARGLGLLGAIYMMQSTCFFISAQRIPVAMTSILLYLYPALVALLAWIFLRERLTARLIWPLVLALAGGILIVRAPEAGQDGLGIGLGLLAALLYSIYIVLGSRLQAGLPAQVASAFVISSAGLIFLVGGALLGELQLDLPARAYLPIIGMALLCTVLPIQTFFAGMRRIGAAQASIVSAVEPVGTALLGALLLGEAVGTQQLAGGVLVVAAVVLLARRRGLRHMGAVGA